jgi:transcriptional regulator with XRE-family HTH domain
MAEYFSSDLVIYLRKCPPPLLPPHTLAAMTIFMSTGRRRELGAELRRIREGRGYTGIDMATRLNWTHTMLSRAETGKRPMSELEVAVYMGLCGVTGHQLHELLELAGEPDDFRLKPHPRQIPDELRALVFHESTASAIDLYEPIYIPGVTQTPEYARAVFEETGKFEGQGIETRVQIRMGRRDILTRYNPAQCTLWVHENALRSMVGGPQVMAEQMLHLLFASSRPQCSIRVIPTLVGCRGLSNGSFEIFRYAEDSPVVYVEHEITSEFLENGEALLAYQAILDRVASVALTETASRAFIGSMASEYERRGATQDEDGAGRSPGLAQE